MAHALYIHIPFCINKCPYCGFYSIAGADGALIEKYMNAMLEVIASLGRPEIDTIYIGGGTPSHIGSRLSAFVKAMLPLVDYKGGEFTIELNPESVSVELCRGLAELPVTRVSMGAQSMDAQILALLGRSHSAEQTRTAYKMLRSKLKADINLDFIYDIPGADWAIMKQSLEEIIALAPDHISAYSYSPDTGYLSANASDDPFQMEQVCDILTRAGYARYEISNFALPGKESKHNIRYWNMDEYFGIGASAHSMAYDTRSGRRVRYSHKADIEHYIADPTNIDNPEIYSPEDCVRESAVFGLRQVSGFNPHAISERHGCQFDEEFFNKINVLIKEGLLTKDGANIRATNKGLLLLNSVQEFLW